MMDWFCRQVLPSAVNEYKTLSDRDLVEQAANRAQLERVRSELDTICKLSEDNPQAKAQCDNVKTWLSQTDEFKNTLLKRNPK